MKEPRPVWTRFLQRLSSLFIIATGQFACSLEERRLVGVHGCVWVRMTRSVLMIDGNFSAKKGQCRGTLLDSSAGDGL